MASSVYLNRRRRASETPNDETYLIYGDSASGKTYLASTFPKTVEAPQLYANILEDGLGSTEIKDRDKIEEVPLETFEEVDAFFTDVYNGYTISDKGERVEMKFSSIVIDSSTNLEFLIKKYLQRSSGKSSMTINLWGQKSDTDEALYNLMKSLYRKLQIPVVIISHTKKIKDDENPKFNKEIPSMQERAARSLAAKTSFVWFTKVEKENAVVDGKVQTQNRFMCYIDTHPYLLTKTRKPPSFKIPEKVEDLTYLKFKTNVLDKIQPKAVQPQAKAVETPDEATPDEAPATEEKTVKKPETPVTPDTVATVKSLKSKSKEEKGDVA